MGRRKQPRQANYTFGSPPKRARRAVKPQTKYSGAAPILDPNELDRLIALERAEYEDSHQVNDLSDHKSEPPDTDSMEPSTSKPTDGGDELDQLGHVLGTSTDDIEASNQRLPDEKSSFSIDVENSINVIQQSSAIGEFKLRKKGHARSEGRGRGRGRGRGKGKGKIVKTVEDFAIWDVKSGTSANQDRTDETRGGQDLEKGGSEDIREGLDQTTGGRNEIESGWEQKKVELDEIRHGRDQKKDERGEIQSGQDQKEGCRGQMKVGRNEMEEDQNADGSDVLDKDKIEWQQGQPEQFEDGKGQLKDSEQGDDDTEELVTSSQDFQVQYNVFNRSDVQCNNNKVQLPHDDTVLVGECEPSRLRPSVTRIPTTFSDFVSDESRGILALHRRVSSFLEAKHETCLYGEERLRRLSLDIARLKGEIMFMRREFERLRKQLAENRKQLVRQGGYEKRKPGSKRRASL